MSLALHLWIATAMAPSPPPSSAHRPAYDPSAERSSAAGELVARHNERHHAWSASPGAGAPPASDARSLVPTAGCTALGLSGAAEGGGTSSGRLGGTPLRPLSHDSQLLPPLLPDTASLLSVSCAAMHPKACL